MKKELKNREDIYNLVSEFYNKLLVDDRINYFFTEMVENDHLEQHLQVLVDFWDNMLFCTGVYNKNAMRPHLTMHLKKPFLKEHFIIWLDHFHTTIDELFVGETAHATKTRSQSIAMVMEMKVNAI